MLMVATGCCGPIHGCGPCSPLLGDCRIAGCLPPCVDSCVDPCEDLCNDGCTGCGCRPRGRLLRFPNLFVRHTYCQADYFTPRPCVNPCAPACAAPPSCVVPRSCAVPPTCAVAATCVAPASCVAPSCCAPSCEAPVCAAPVCAAPACEAPVCAPACEAPARCVPSCAVPPGCAAPASCVVPVGCAPSTQCVANQYLMSQFRAIASLGHSPLFGGGHSSVRKTPVGNSLARNSAPAHKAPAAGMQYKSDREIEAIYARGMEQQADGSWVPANTKQPVAASFSALLPAFSPDTNDSVQQASHGEPSSSRPKSTGSNTLKKSYSSKQTVQSPVIDVPPAPPAG